MPRGKPSDKTLTLRYPLEYDPKINALVTRMPGVTWIFPGCFGPVKPKRRAKTRRSQ